MPIETTCPSCQRALRVPDELIDHSVTCPECGTEWLAAAPSKQSDSIALLEPGLPAVTGPMPDAIREIITAPPPTPDDHIRESPIATESTRPPPSSDDE